MNDRVWLQHGDCLNIMQEIPDGSVDMILCDLPYGVTKNRWDSCIPFEPLWAQYNRIIKKNGAIVLFADGLFMARLMLSNPKMWRYNLVWDKALSSGFLNANRMPLRQHEELCVFYKSQPTYNPQKKPGKQSHSKGASKSCKNNNYGNYGFVDNAEKHGNMKFPTSIWRHAKVHPAKAIHPTEKPVSLCEELILTYTNPGDTVLDNCMGTCAVGVACVRTGRKFIGMDSSEDYFIEAISRISHEKGAFE